jgi:hypothetical protein
MGRGVGCETESICTDTNGRVVTNGRFGLFSCQSVCPLRSDGRCENGTLSGGLKQIRLNAFKHA